MLLRPVSSPRLPRDDIMDCSPSHVNTDPVCQAQPQSTHTRCVSTFKSGLHCQCHTVTVARTKWPRTKGSLHSHWHLTLTSHTATTVPVYRFPRNGNKFKVQVCRLDAGARVPSALMMACAVPTLHGMPHWQLHLSKLTMLAVA